jgi:hypothetical protein
VNGRRGWGRGGGGGGERMGGKAEGVGRGGIMMGQWKTGRSQWTSVDSGCKEIRRKLTTTRNNYDCGCKEIR